MKADIQNMSLTKYQSKVHKSKIQLMIRNFMANIVGLFLILSGVYFQKKKDVHLSDNITSVFFHNPQKRVFKNTIKWLIKNKYTFLSSDELADILINKKPVPHKAVWISFDDGWKDNLANVVSIIAKYNIPVIFFISTGPVKSDGFFWFSVAMNNQQNLPDEYKKNVKRLWYIKNKEREKIIENLKAGYGFKHKRESLTVEDIKKISGMPQITIGCHTVNHVIMPNCTKMELEEEIKQSKYDLEKWTGEKIKYFAYPNGDFNDLSSIILKKYGFEMAATTESRLININDNIFCIPRIAIMDEEYFFESRCRLVGLWTDYITGFKKFIKRFGRKQFCQKG